MDVTDRHGETPLHWAANRGSLGVAQALLAAGATEVAKNSTGQTPLDLALINGMARMAHLLRSVTMSDLADVLSSDVDESRDSGASRLTPGPRVADVHRIYPGVGGAPVVPPPPPTLSGEAHETIAPPL